MKMYVVVTCLVQFRKHKYARFSFGTVLVLLLEVALGLLYCWGPNSLRYPRATCNMVTVNGNGEAQTIALQVKP